MKEKLVQMLADAFDQAQRNRADENQALLKARDALIALLAETENLGPEQSFYLVREYFRDQG